MNKEESNQTSPSAAQNFAQAFPEGSTINPRSLERLMNVPVQISVELGRKKIRISELLQMGPGSTIDLPTLAGEPLDIRVNNKLIAKGEAVSVGEMYGVRIIEVVTQDLKESVSKDLQ